MNKNIILLIVILISANSTAQTLKLNRSLDIDTLHVWLNYHADVDSKTRNSIDSGLIIAIDNFHGNESAFVIILDSIQNDYSLHMTMQPIKYAKPLGQVLNTAYNLALIPFHYFVNYQNNLYIPLTPLFINSRSIISYVPTDSLFLHKKKINSFGLSGRGYLRKQDKQYTNLINNADDHFLKFFCAIAKEDKRKKK